MIQGHFDIGIKSVEIMLRFRYIISLLKHQIAANTPRVVASQWKPGLRLISAVGDGMPILEHVKTVVAVGGLVK